MDSLEIFTSRWGFVKFSSIPVGMSVTVDFAGLVQAAVLPRVHGNNISILLRRHYQASDIPDF